MVVLAPLELSAAENLLFATAWLLAWQNLMHTEAILCMHMVTMHDY